MSATDKVQEAADRLKALHDAYGIAEMRDKSAVTVSMTEPTRMLAEIDAALVDRPELRLFLYNGAVIQIREVPAWGTNAKGEMTKVMVPGIHILDETDMLLVFTDVLKFLKAEKVRGSDDDGEPAQYKANITACPTKVPQLYLAWTGKKLHVLKKLSLTPTITEPRLIKKDGRAIIDPSSARVLQTEGYDEETGIYLLLKDDFPTVPEDCNEFDAWVGVEEVLDLLRECRFAEEHDRMGAVAAMLFGIIRPWIPGGGPLFALTSDQPNTGKSTLVRIISVVVSGKEPSRLTQAKGDENQKARDTALLQSHPVVVYENVTSIMAGGDLATIMTEDTKDIRLFHTQRDVPCSTRLLWLTTTNNLEIDRDLSAGRCCVIRLDRLGETAKYADMTPERTARMKRPTVVSALLRIVRAYVNAGSPVVKIADEIDPRRPEFQFLVHRALAWAWTLECTDRKPTGLSPCFRRAEDAVVGDEGAVDELGPAWLEAYKDRAVFLKPDLIDATPTESLSKPEGVELAEWEKEAVHLVAVAKVRGIVRERLDVGSSAKAGKVTAEAVSRLLKRAMGSGWVDSAGTSWRLVQGARNRQNGKPWMARRAGAR
jgi:hypothetical protein